MKFINFLYRLTMPGGIILLLAFSLLRLGILSGSDGSRINFYPLILLGVALVLSGIFHRSRLFLACLVITISHAALVWLAPHLSPASQRVLFNAVAFLLPLNLLGFSFLQDRGIISPAGERRLAFIGLQVAIVSALMLPRFSHLAELLQRQFVPSKLSAWSGLAQPALAAFVLASIVIAVLLAMHYSTINNSLLWSAISIFIGLRAGVAGYKGAAYFAGAGLLLTIAVLEASYSMAYLDELTRLPSRRALNEALLKLGDSYAIAMLDVDHFKKFNDSYGHEAGDQALRMVASKLAHVTGGGKAYRYGGEEFAVLFPGKPVEEAFTYLDRMRRLIEQSRFVVRGHDRRRGKRRKSSRQGKTETNVTVSVGIAASNGDPVTTEQVLRSADQALYQAKARGRNCTVVARSLKPHKSEELKIRVLQVS